MGDCPTDGSSVQFRGGGGNGIGQQSRRQSTERTIVAKKKKLPKQLAILDEDLCTGCDACVTVCPVDCIDKIADPTHPGYAMGICTIDLQVCIGCKLCAQVCPWDVITMIPSEQVVMEPKYAALLEGE